MAQIECTIVKVRSTEVKVLFSEDISKILEEKWYTKGEFWIVESPIGTKIPTEPAKYDPEKQIATIKLKSRLKKDNWVRFTLVKDIKVVDDSVIAQTSARVGDIDTGGEEDGKPNLADAIQDLSSYPFPVTDATIAEPPSGGISGPTSLTRLVDGAMKTALGRLPKPNDTRSFVGALNQSFTLSQSEGHTVVEWTPHSLSGTTDLGGGVTGAQASLVAFARNSLDASLPLLDGLYSLIPDADPQKVETTRSIVHNQWIEVVERFETPGGPTDSRVLQLFESVESQTKDLGELLGMLDEKGDITRVNVIDIDEETNLTNFISFRNHVSFVKKYYDEYSALRTTQVDLGTGLTLLARALSVVGEQVAEVYASMDSVYVGPAERQVIYLKLDDGSTMTEMTVEELMSWVETFATEEAPRLVQDGGLGGVQAIKPTVKKLKSLTEDFVKKLDDSKSELPVSLRQRRVRNTLRELVKYLTEVETRIEHLVAELHVERKKKDLVDELQRDIDLLKERLRKLDGDGAVEPKMAA